MPVRILFRIPGFRSRRPSSHVLSRAHGNGVEEGRNEKEFTKYNKKDKKTFLEPEDDAATAGWGAGWRIPTQSECEELCRNTDHIKTVHNGVSGMLFKSKKNGKSIFFPFAGYY